jgi:uncharacterized protein (TIGR00251 family)
MFEIKVKPNSSREGLELASDGKLILKVRSPATDGQANERVIELLSKIFDVRKSAIEIMRGQTSRTKLIRIEGVSELQVLKAAQSSGAIS